MAVAVKDANGRLVGGIAIFPDRGTLLDRHIFPLYFGKDSYGLILDNKGVMNVMNVTSDIADQASDQVRSIATASEEQSASSEEIMLINFFLFTILIFSDSAVFVNYLIRPRDAITLFICLI